MADLAGLAGVSTITVSRALSGSSLVSPETRERVQQLAGKHGYKLNVSARNLRLRRSHAVAVIVEMTPTPERTMWDPYPLALLGGISQELTSAQYNVLLTTRQAAGDVVAQAADGLILLGQGAHQDAVRAYDRLGLPMVVWGAAGVGGDQHIVVGSDNRLGGISVAERFVSIGRRHPVFIGNPDHPEMAQRLFGFVDELGRHGIKPLLMRRADFTLESGVQAVRSLHNRHVQFDAIFACSDLVAMGAIRALIELGLSVPEDVSVIGYDDTPQGATFLPPLSSVRQNWQEGGVLLARKVLDMIRGEVVESQMMPTALVLRST
ncbi:LacI family transcription regulator [mine drainage metagenome]|uniref:LacI family transcription regulator n=1 Tax=mine drainage metagenome TaxID=410659 RepID=T0ZKK6_9ZZZZ